MRVLFRSDLHLLRPSPFAARPGAGSRVARSAAGAAAVTMLHADAAIETWGLAKPFIISRERFDHVDIVVVTLDDGVHRGRGESCPAGHYGETHASDLAQTAHMPDALESRAERDAVHQGIAPGPEAPGAVWAGG